MTILAGERVTLRPATADDVPALARIRATPEVRRWWGGDEPMTKTVANDLAQDDVTTLAGHLFTSHGHHRLVIDPAADNTAAIRCYAKVGFRPVGVMRRYELGPDGVWHDGLLMDLLVEEFDHH